MSSCFTAILFAVPADGYWPNLVWIGQQTSLHSLFLPSLMHFNSRCSYCQPNYCWWYNCTTTTRSTSTSSTTSHRLLLYCYCCAVIIRLRLRNVLLSLIFLIPVFSMLPARLLLCSRSCLLLLSLPYSRPVRLPSSGNCTIFCTPVTIILSLNPIRPPVHGQQHETPATQNLTYFRRCLRQFWKNQHPSISSLLHIHFLYPFLENIKQLY